MLTVQILKDWGCPSEGISGNEKIIDVGGEPYMHDPKFIGTEFDYEEISKKIGSEKSYALGAGSGAQCHVWMDIVGNLPLMKI